jgi:hypothetical protein
LQNNRRSYFYAFDCGSRITKFSLTRGNANCTRSWGPCKRLRRVSRNCFTRRPQTRLVCGAEKILKLVEWGADLNAQGRFGTFDSMAATHPDQIIRNLALDNRQLLRHYVLHKNLVTAADSDGVESMLDLLKTTFDFDLNKEPFENLHIPQTTLSAHTLNELPKIKSLLAHSAKLDAPALQYSNVLQLYLDRKVPYVPVLEYLFKSGVNVNAPIGLHRNRVVSDFAGWHHVQESMAMPDTCMKVVSPTSAQGFLSDDGSQTLLK